MTSYPAILHQLRRDDPAHIEPLGGGCIARASTATWSDGFQVFIKQASLHPTVFHREATGLKALAETKTLRIPEVLAVDNDALVLEWIEPGNPGNNFFADFGQRLAELHMHSGPVCGFPDDNFIGATPQINQPVNNRKLGVEPDAGHDWPAFFIERRLRYQVQLAAKNGYGEELSELLDSSLDNIVGLLEAAIEPPSLLHGDLWAGNFLVDGQGLACLIDPACYYGHRETDLAMTALFGGFDQDFYTAYCKTSPLMPGWKERQPLYQLYHLLNHLNLFGRSYYGRCQSILQNSAS